MTQSHEIRTARLHLRPLRESDRAEYIRCQVVNREHFAPWWPARDPAVTDDAHFDEQLRRCAEGLERGTDVRMVGLLEGGAIVALVSLSQIFRGPFQNAYIGWSVSVEHVGRGLATEAVHALLDLAFANPSSGLGLHRVQANIIPRNAPSLRVAEKCGFRREGLARSYLRIAGAWEDHLMFAKLAEEHGGTSGAT